MVFEVVPWVLSMFDESLGDNAMKTYKREGIEIETYGDPSERMTLTSLTRFDRSHHVEEVRPGLPESATGQEWDEEHQPEACYTIKTKEGKFASECVSGASAT